MAGSKTRSEEEAGRSQGHETAPKLSTKRKLTPTLDQPQGRRRSKRRAVTVESVSGADHVLNDTGKKPGNSHETPKHSPPKEDAHKLHLRYQKGNLFDADPNAILAHSCNCQGTWGKGIALEFKSRFPQHFEVYKSYCKSQKASDLVGTALLIGPHIDQIRNDTWVGCLFTRLKPGKVPASMAESDQVETCVNTTSAMTMLLEQITDRCPGSMNKIAMPKINAGLFAVPWERTVAALKCARVSMNGSSTVQITVFEP